MPDPINPQTLYPLFNEVQISTIQPEAGAEDKPRIVLTYLRNEDVGPAVKALLAVARIVASVGEGATVDEALADRDKVFDAEFNSAAMRKNVETYEQAAAEGFAKGLGANAGMFNVPDNSSGSAVDLSVPRRREIAEYGVDEALWALAFAANFSIVSDAPAIKHWIRQIIQAGYNAARDLDPNKVYLGEQGN